MCTRYQPISMPQSTCAHSAGAVEYTDWTYAMEWASTQQSSCYDTKQSDSEVPVIL